MQGQALLEEFLVGDPIENIEGIFACRIVSLPDEAIDNAVIECAAFCCTGILIERIDGIKSQNAFGIDRVGIPPEATDLAEGEGTRLQLCLRSGCRSLCRRLVVAIVQQFDIAAIEIAALFEVLLKCRSTQRQQALQPARGDGRCRSLAQRTRKDQPPGAAGHFEIMCDLTNLPLWRL